MYRLGSFRSTVASAALGLAPLTVCRFVATAELPPAALPFFGIHSPVYSARLLWGRFVNLRPLVNRPVRDLDLCPGRRIANPPQDGIRDGMLPHSKSHPQT